MTVLAGDIGGTNTRLALVDAGKVLVEKRYPSAAHAGLEEIVEAFLADVGQRPERGCLAVAGPVENDVCKVTNLPWVVDARAMERRVGMARVRVVNDFYAAALGITALRPAQLLSLGGAQAPQPRGPIAVLGAGTGLGVAFLIHNGTQYEPVPSEGSHREFGPRNGREIRLLQFLQGKHGRASYERVLSGPGLQDLYAFLSSESPAQVLPSTRAAMEQEDPASVVTRLGLDGKDPLCKAAVDIFLAVLGAEAGNLGLQVVASGGVYIAGGIAPRLATRINDGTLRAAFDDKGRLASVARRIPAFLVQEPQLGILGAAAAAERL